MMLRSPALVGRGDELAAVQRAVTAARAGAGRLLLVAGEAGIGKSRLIAEAARLAADLGMPVLTGHAVEDSGPYRPVAEALLGGLRGGTPDLDELRPYRAALGRLLPGWAEPTTEPTPGVDPVVVLGEGVLRLLGLLGGDQGCLLVLEDLHWADRDTLALLEYLVSVVPMAPVLLVASYRSDAELPGVLRRLAVRPAVTRVPLARLGAEATAQLAAACAGGAILAPEVLEFLAGAAEGVPFLVEELLAGLVESGRLDPRHGWVVRGPLAAEVPDSLGELVDRRLAGLTPAAHRVLEAAAVAGRALDWTLLGAITGLDEDAVIAGLRAAVTAYLLDGERFEWRHALVRDAVLARLLPPERARLAARTAEAMEHNDTELSGPDAILIADLYARAGDSVRAERILLRLSRRALTSGALGTAEDLLDRVGSGTEAAIARVQLLTLTGRASEALSAGEAALPAAAGAERVELCLRLARAAIAAARWDDALGYLRRAGHTNDPRIAAIAADAAYGAGRVGEARALAEAAASTAERTGLPAVACEALEVVGRCIRSAGSPGEAAAVFRRAADLAEEHGLVPWRIRALFGLGTVEMLDSEHSAHIDTARELAVDAGMLAQVIGIDLIQASGGMLVDGPASTVGTAERIADRAGRLRLHQLQALALLMVAEGHGAAGRPSAMHAALDASSAMNSRSPDAVAATSAAAAVAAVLDRDLPRALDLLDAAAAIALDHGSVAPLHHWGLWALLHAVLDEGDDARDRLAGSPVVARAVNRAGLRYAEAVAAGRNGRPDEAVELFRRGDALIGTAHWWRRLLQLLVHEAALADGWGDPVAGLRALLADFDTDADGRLARTCRDLLRSAGAPVPRRGRGDSPVPAGLRALGVTSREMDVLTLVAQGLTNAEIAGRLFLSVRTVDTHVANLLAKTGVPTRGGLGVHLTP
jgi:DNA-binding CsgD family transcriptional regulator/tetratricopeptide (TPR) repeat protein